MAHQWVEEFRTACQHQNAAFFLQQWGGTREGWNGRLLDGETWDEHPPAAVTVAHVCHPVKSSRNSDAGLTPVTNR